MGMPLTSILVLGPTMLLKFKYASFALALALAGGCTKKKSEPASGSGAGSGSAAVATAPVDAIAVDSADVIPPYTIAQDVPAPIRAAVEAADRDVADRKLDAGRRPAEVLAFFKVAPGQKIGELFAGGGYTTEILARTVGDGGTVYAQNTKEVLDRFARAPWTARAAKPVMKNAVAVERPTDDPFPPEAKNLDTVITILNYHDFVWQKADTAKLNKLVFERLKKGGIYGIVDHHAAAGSGTRDCETLHRIDIEVVKKEVLAAGFKLEAETDLLAHAEDKRDWNTSPKNAGEKRGTSDRFTLRFVKP